MMGVQTTNITVGTKACKYVNSHSLTEYITTYQILFPRSVIDLVDKDFQRNSRERKAAKRKNAAQRKWKLKHLRL